MRHDFDHGMQRSMPLKMDVIGAIAPDRWSVTVGHVTVNLHGYNDVSQEACWKLMVEIGKVHNLARLPRTISVGRMSK